MLDVHPLHKPLHGFWEFLLHLFTITVGLLIATQIESCMEWRHHVHVAGEARAQLRAEIESNLKDLKQAQLGVKTWREQIDADLTAMQNIQEHPKDPRYQQANMTVNANSMTLRDAAWRTAQSTGALAYMPYREAEKYSGVYEAQSALLAMEDKPAEDVAGIVGLMARYHSRSGHSARITTEEAAALTEKFGQMREHLAIGDSLVQTSIELSTAFLENREPRPIANVVLH